MSNSMARYVDRSNLPVAAKSRIAEVIEMTRTPAVQLAMEREGTYGMAVARSFRDTAECMVWSAAMAAVHGFTEKGLDRTAVPADAIGFLAGSAMAIFGAGTEWGESGKNLQKSGISILTYRKVLAACEAMSGKTPSGPATSKMHGESSSSVEDDPVVVAGRMHLGLKKAA